MDNGAVNTLNLRLQDVLEISPTTHSLFIEGDSTDTVTSPSAWGSSTGTTLIGSVTYDIYHLGSATLFVDNVVSHGGL